MEILLFWLPGRVAGPEVGPGRKWQGLGPALSIASAATGYTAYNRMHCSYVNRANFSQASRGFVSDSWAFLLFTDRVTAGSAAMKRVRYAVCCLSGGRCSWCE